MAKLCFTCDASREARKGMMTPTFPLNEIVDSSQCEDCQSRLNETKHFNEVEQPKIIIEFIQNISEIDRDSIWKQKLIDKILPTN